MDSVTGLYFYQIQYVCAQALTIFLRKVYFEGDLEAIFKF